MARQREQNEWNEKFLEYMEFIAKHENYKGLLIKRNKEGELCWFSTKKSATGKSRMEWAIKKAEEFEIPNEAGVFAKVMLKLHPTKLKVCQICGEQLSLYYIYANKNFLKGLKKDFGYDFEYTQSIFEIISELQENDIDERKIKSFLCKKFKLEKQHKENKMEVLLEECVNRCLNGYSKMLGPGAMSNFPDRYDGFHTYNRCCREFKDKGRWEENMRTYIKDRRAYEHWSDGNIHAANKFMKSIFFSNISADHIGPISLGFVHDSHYLRPMVQRDNSSRRDRLDYDDIELIIDIEIKTQIKAMSWYSLAIWEYIKKNYMNNIDKIENYRIALKQNMTNFMEVLSSIINDCGEEGKKFLVDTLLEPKFSYFNYSYGFNESGEIIKKSNRHITDATKKETDRFIRIALEAVSDYHNKDNRNVKTSLDEEDNLFLKSICDDLKSRPHYEEIHKKLIELMGQVQEKLIKSI